MPEKKSSDSDPGFQPVKAPSRKRKATAGGTSTAKKAKAASGSSSNSGVLDESISQIASSIINSKVEHFTNAEVQENPIDVAEKLAQYIKQLETALGEAKSSGGTPVAKQKTRAELEAAAEKIRKTAVSGITKQMTWRPSCKTNTAKWLYDGLCADPDVFGTLMGLDGPPTWKIKKLPKETFEGLLGGISAPARFCTLSLTGTEVNVRYYPDSGEFKFSGTYGGRGY
ncbi:hypothetical protein EI94DRAFT_1683951 [Lactarius quietus]|nr:hypothetical protein EI94DRAFT_1683951 [Lactarius quietus]